ncbi:hypothetical protein BD779DRAFT_1563656 [Infundibulicybe gibba]|nr:hypothetical protein BD779DRAFT_1563656 [Infundibulicybe gibba]
MGKGCMVMQFISLLQLLIILQLHYHTRPLPATPTHIHSPIVANYKTTAFGNCGVMIYGVGEVATLGDGVAVPGCDSTTTSRRRTTMRT